MSTPHTRHFFCSGIGLAPTPTSNSYKSRMAKRSRPIRDDSAQFNHEWTQRGTAATEAERGSPDPQQVRRNDGVGESARARTGGAAAAGDSRGPAPPGNWRGLTKLFGIVVRMNTDQKGGMIVCPRKTQKGAKRFDPFASFACFADQLSTICVHWCPFAVLSPSFHHLPRQAKRCRSSSSTSPGSATVWAISARNRWRKFSRRRSTAIFTAPSVMLSFAAISA